MADFSGSFAGHARVLTTVAVGDVSGHEFQTVEISGPVSSTDSNWNGASVGYWGFADLTLGSGTQKGYFVNFHSDGSRDWGTFEASVSTTPGGTTTEGSWRFVNGTGKFKGITGQGTFTTRLTSPMDVECEWKGRYQFAAAAQAA